MHHRRGKASSSSVLDRRGATVNAPNARKVPVTITTGYSSTPIDVPESMKQGSKVFPFKLEDILNNDDGTETGLKNMLQCFQKVRVKRIKMVGVVTHTNSASGSTITAPPFYFFNFGIGKWVETQGGATGDTIEAQAVENASMKQMAVTYFVHNQMSQSADTAFAENGTGLINQFEKTVLYPKFVVQNTTGTDDLLSSGFVPCSTAFDATWRGFLATINIPVNATTRTGPFYIYHYFTVEMEFQELALGNLAISLNPAITRHLVIKPSQKVQKRKAIGGRRKTPYSK